MHCKWQVSNCATQAFTLRLPSRGKCRSTERAQGGPFCTLFLPHSLSRLRWSSQKQFCPQNRHCSGKRPQALMISTRDNKSTTFSSNGTGRQTDGERNTDRSSRETRWWEVAPWATDWASSELHIVSDSSKPCEQFRWSDFSESSWHLVQAAERRRNHLHCPSSSTGRTSCGKDLTAPCILIFVEAVLISQCLKIHMKKDT